VALKAQETIMKKVLGIKWLTASVMAFALFMVPNAAIAQQTVIKASNNKYNVQDDVKLGQQAAAEIEKQFPIMNDRDANDYIERVGQRLVDSIPAQFNQPAFNYRFKLVNARDLNAFALPGGPMYVNRGMIESARNEGELAGVMAHEISHIALRHATAQATRQSSAKSTLGTIGLILGGAILGGQTGAQLGGLFAQGWQTKYSREYESEADILGARIMAGAGYDPRDLANVFQTIAQERGRGGAPEWLSSHPDPGNRYDRINREARYLRVSSEPIRTTRDFERIQARFRAMPTAPSMAEIEKGYRTEQTGTIPTASGRYSSRVQAPSSRMRQYSGLNWLRVNVPSNWQDFGSQDSVQFAPQGAFGPQGITRGAIIGAMQSNTRDLQRDTQTYVNQIMQANPYLQQRTSFSQVNFGGRRGYVMSASGRSPITGQTELVTIYTTQLRSGDLVYIATVVPERESRSYDNAFRNMLNSIGFSD
jgi:predicted Zn-dependent protease